MPLPIEFRTLASSGQMVELGRGGEGAVFKVPNLGDKVYKEFLAASYTSPDHSALTRLIDLQNQWTPEEKVWLTNRTVWPETIVLDNGNLKGFVMPGIQRRYFRKHGIRLNPKTVLCEWNYLSLRTKFHNNPNIVTEVPRVTPPDALALVHDFAKTMKILHKYGVIIGDISGKNLLWTDTPSFQVMVIDCDSFRIMGQGGVASPKQSPDWDDPHLNGKPTSQESDIYKLAIAAFRAIWASGTDRPSAPSYVVPAAPQGVPDEVRGLIARSLQPTGRPTAEEWEKVLALPAMFRGRPAVKMGTSSGSRPSQPNPNHGTPMGTPRPTVNMKRDETQ
jgi:hypothetical protein